MKRLVTCMLMIGVIASCSTDEHKEIEDEIRIHFSSFESEAFARGIEIDLIKMQVSALVEEIESGMVVGQCNSYSDGAKEVVFDESYWNRSNMNEREYLVFHELGHCVLNREHNNEKDEKGNCISIMQSGENVCSKRYGSTNRESLLDELFEEF